MRSASYTCLAALVLLCVVACNGETYPSNVGSVYFDAATGSYSFVAGKMDKSAAAWGNFTDQTMHPSAFGELFVFTNGESFNDTVQMYAAGYLEGSLTYVRNYQHWENLQSYVNANFKNDQMPAIIGQWMNEQDAWVRQNIASNHSDLWQQMANLYAQFDGLVAGHTAHAGSLYKMSRLDFMVTNGIGDLLDLIPALDPSVQPDWARMTEQEMIAAIALRGHCSGFIKVTGNYSDLFAGHSSWFTYSSMLRIFKHYNLAVSSPDSNGKQMSFSSYPSLLSSLDDFYMLHHSNMVMVQTTNGILNQTLYKKVTNKALLAWHRVRLANMMADSGEEWANIVSQYNSGTYNNQYMVVDYKLFTPGKALPDNTLWVTEQIPGLMMSADVTQQLERGYWPSYNVPYFPEIYELSGYTEFTQKFQATHPQAVAGVSYQLAPRAMIFRRDQGKAVDIESFKRVLRSNDYRTDPYSHDNPFAAICSRGDLAGQTGGCYDTKVGCGQERCVVVVHVWLSLECVWDRLHRMSGCSSRKHLSSTAPRQRVAPCRPSNGRRSSSPLHTSVSRKSTTLCSRT